MTPPRITLEDVAWGLEHGGGGSRTEREAALCRSAQLVLDSARRFMGDHADIVAEGAAYDALREALAAHAALDGEKP
jgi:hypothetical protein